MNMRVAPPRADAACACAHCGLPVPPGARFCCAGCEAAFGFIQGMGLGLYYERRVLDASQPALKPEASALSNIQAYIRSDGDGLSELNLMVDGIQCGACVWLIESVLAAQEGVVQGRVNMTTRRLRLKWQERSANIEDVLASIERLGYRLAPYDPASVKAANDRTAQTLMKALAVAGFAAGNLMLLSIGIWVGFSQGMGEAVRSLMHWVSAIIALPAIAYAGRPFFRSAWNALTHGRANMDVPISIGILLVTGMSLVETIRGGAHTYFDSAAMLLFFLLVGRVLDQRARGKAREAAEQLIALRVIDVAVLRADGTIERRAQESVRAGERVLVGIGERVGVDGIIESGSSSIDASLVTGESLPAPVEPGAKVFSGSINLDSPLTVLVTGTGEATLLAECVRLIEAAEHGRGRFVALADKVARLYAPVVHIAALATFLVWWLALGMAWPQALLIAASVLIITCPCALALAVPAVQVIATGRLFRRGILLKSPSALERLASVDTIVFDKTGTLTEPNLRLRAEPCWTAEDLAQAAALCAASRHPLARALVAAAPFVRPADGVMEVAGAGLRWNGPQGEIRVGSRAFCGVAAGDSDGPELWFARPDRPPIRFRFEETLRSDATETLSQLAQKNYPLFLYSGDRAEPVRAIAERAGIANYEAELSPASKVAKLAAFQSRGGKVLMVGDGLNDGPALAAASVSMSPSTAADLSQTIADVVFQGNSLRPVAIVLATAKAARHLIKENIGLSIAYNLVMVPLAVLGHVTPWLAAAAMSGSSLIVILNSLRLGRERLP
jgi:P-type Cu2+ transporter